MTSVLDRIVLIGVLVSGLGTAHADDAASSFGITMVTGGGVTAFTSSDMQHAAGTGLEWSARAAIGSRLPFGLELTYSGDERGVAVPGTHDGSLQGESVGVALRIALLPRHRWSLFGFSGIGWQRYSIAGAMTSAPVDLKTEDEAMIVPVGAGVIVRIAPGIILDVRGSYRMTRPIELIQATGGGYASMNAWEATAAFGLEL